MRKCITYFYIKVILSHLNKTVVTTHLMRHPVSHGFCNRSPAGSFGKVLKVKSNKNGQIYAMKVMYKDIPTRQLLTS